MAKTIPNHLLILQDSGNTEHYTPPHIIEAARKAMGGIDLDPASCATANAVVKARKFYTVADDGLAQPWNGRIWLNWPYSRKGNPAWVSKLMREYKEGRVQQACCICYASTSERWFHHLLKLPQCFLFARTRFIGSDGKVQPAPTKGCVVTYFGANVQGFAGAFQGLGEVKVSFEK